MSDEAAVATEAEEGTVEGTLPGTVEQAVPITIEDVKATLGLDREIDAGEVEGELEGDEGEEEAPAPEAPKEEKAPKPDAGVEAKLAAMEEKITALNEALEKATEEVQPAVLEDQVPAPVAGEPRVFVTPEEFEEFFSDPAKTNEVLQRVYAQAAQDVQTNLLRLLPPQIQRVVQAQLTSKDESDQVLVGFVTSHREELKDPRMMELFVRECNLVQNAHPGKPMQEILDAGWQNMTKTRDAFMAASGGTPPSKGSGGSTPTGSRRTLRRGQQKQADSIIAKHAAMLGLKLKGK